MSRPKPPSGYRLLTRLKCDQCGLETFALIQHGSEIWLWCTHYFCPAPPFPSDNFADLKRRPMDDLEAQKFAQAVTP